jgi:uncharacterized protein
MFAQPFIDSTDFAKNGREMCGEISVDKLPRLADVLANQGGVLSYKLSGSQEDDRYILSLEVHGVCQLRCQRCLDAFSYPVNMAARLQLLPQDRLDEVNEVDDVDAVEASRQLDVLALIEDEVLLGLPFAPRHEEGECGPAVNSLQQSVNPFAVLAGLKKQ